jgi:hypothetical protein
MKETTRKIWVQMQRHYKQCGDVEWTELLRIGYNSGVL